jgi:protein-disulfide isomerase
MNPNKQKFLLIILALVLISALILGISNRRKNKVELSNEPLKISGAQVQSYAVSKNPEINETDKIFGDKDAKLKIFVYEDYSNIYSAKLADTLEKIKQEGLGLNIVVRPYISSDLLPKSSALAMACSGDKWVEMRALLFAQVKNNQLSLDSISANAKQLGLNEAEFNNCLTNPDKFRTIERSLEEAKTYSVNGAPTLFIGDEMVLGARPYDDYVDSNDDKIEGLKQVVTRKLAE